MKAKTEKTVKPTIATRKPWGRLNEDTKARIINEIGSGLLSERAAGRKYGLPKSNIGKWHDKHNLATLLSPKIPDGLLAMDESKESKLLKKKIKELTKALCYTPLLPNEHILQQLLKTNLGILEKVNAINRELVHLNEISRLITEIHKPHFTKDE